MSCRAGYEGLSSWGWALKSAGTSCLGGAKWRGRFKVGLLRQNRDVVVGQS